MLPRNGLRLAVGGLLVFSFAAGCSKSSSSSSTSSSGSAEKWKPFPLPDYTRLELEDVSAALRKDIEDHQGEIDELFVQRERMPLGQRYSIPAGEEVYTARKFEADYHQFRREEDLEAYRRFTADRGPVQELGEAFLTEYDRMACYQPGAKPRSEIMPLAEAVFAAGSEDPLLRVYDIILKAGAGEREGLLDQLLVRKQGLTRENSSSLARGLAADWVWTLVQERGGDALVDREHQYAAIDAWVEYLADHAAAPNQRIVWYLPELFFDRQPREQQKEFLLAAYQNGQVHPWVLHYATGKFYSDLGYDHRGSGWASEVSQEGWANLAKYRGLAQGHLLRAWQLAPEHPQPARELMSLARTGHSDRWNVRDWFYEAVRAQIDWMPAYSSLENSLTPRWGGSYEELEQLAADCLATERYDTCVPTYITSIVWTMQKETGQLRAIARRPSVAVLVRKCVDGLSKTLDAGRPCPAADNGVWAQLAFYLLAGDDYESARKCFERMDSEEWLQRPQGWIGMKVSHARGLAYAATGPASENVTVFEELLTNSSGDDLEEGDLQELLELVEQSRRLDAQPQSQPYYADVAAVAKQLQAFHRGEWVTLPFDAQLSGWYLEAGTSEVESDGTLRAVSDAQNFGIQLKPLAQFPSPFVCEAEISLTTDHTDPSSWTGLMYGRTNQAALYDRQPGRGIFLRPYESLVVMSDETNEEKYAGWGVKVPNQEFQLLRLKVWENAIDYSVNHVDIGSEKMPERSRARAFTIGEYLPAKKPNVIRIRNVRVRRADWGPPPDRTDLDAFIAFNGAERDNDPLDPNAWYHLAYGLMLKRDYPAALEAIAGCEQLHPEHLDDAYLHGLTLLRMGRYAEAIPYYQRSIERKSDRMETHSNLAWILAAAPVDGVRDPEAALPLAQRACELANYEHWMPLTALAAAHAERGDFEEAKKWIAKALEVAPESFRELTEKRQAEIEAGRPLRDDGNSPPEPDAEQTPADADDGSPAEPPATEPQDVAAFTVRNTAVIPSWM